MATKAVNPSKDINFVMMTNKSIIIYSYELVLVHVHVLSTVTEYELLYSKYEIQENEALKGV